MQALALKGEWENGMVFRICLEGMNLSNDRVWALERNVGFIDRLLLLGIFTKNVQAKSSCIS